MYISTKIYQNLHRNVNSCYNPMYFYIAMYNTLASLKYISTNYLRFRFGNVSS